ncbi:MAG: hypothetical protein KatS3mg105_3487 [Gemmatales bacterium]|nr:MAG: hypothetical protein KatS3mg105_3166 [Gemmatales bacterium]GIW81680.1 MAG: hypothetical protein KatS3mg105_3487 [Gemmatales bacterium]
MTGSFLFKFGLPVLLAEAEMSLHLAMFAVEGLVGRVRVRMDANYQVDPANHAIRIDGSTRVGQMIACVFAGLLFREFGEDAISIEHVTEQPIQQPEEVHA